MRRTYQHYRILQRADGSLWELGRGEVGITYKAHDVNLGTIVALKVTGPRFSAGAEVCKMLRLAVQAAAQVHHPNVAEVFHFGMLEDCASERSSEDSPPCECFYTMEYIEGESLEERVRRHGPLPILAALEIGLQVARALAEAEKRGLANRSVKASNVMLASDQPNPPGRRIPGQEAIWVKVVDLGLNRPRPLPGADPGRAPDDPYSLGELLSFALCGARPAADGTLPNAQLRARHVPAPVIALLELLFGSKEGKTPPSLATVVALFETCRGSLAEAAMARRRRRSLFACAVLGAALIGLAYYAGRSPAPADKSIAVLPFRKLSQNPGDDFLAEGVRDDIVARLVRILDLKVIGHPRTDVPPDRNPDYRTIGRENGARYLLTGSLRRSEHRVVLKVALIDASDGQEIWSEKYDRKLKDAIDLQSDLAGNVAEAVDVRLGGGVHAAVPASSSLNPDAHLLYLQGRKLEDSVATEVSNYEAAAALYSQAVALDPGFALAHAQLANILGLLYRFRGPSDELRIQAANEAREALRLQPDLGEAHLARGANLYRIDRDLEGALRELEIARNLLPNEAEPIALIALIRRRWGDWREARAGLERAHQLAPQVRDYEQELFATASLLRDWPAAARHADLAIAISPDLRLQAERALVDFWQSGRLEPLQKLIASVSTIPDMRGDLTWQRWDVAMLARDPAGAEAALNAFPFETLPTVLGAPVPKSYLRGCIWLAQGDREQAQASFEMARPSMEAETFAQPGNAMRHARLGLLYAYMGRKAEALREGQRAVEITPVFEDAVDGHHWACNLALIQAWVGDISEAVASIESLLRQPGCVSPLNEACLTQWDLRTRWQWDPLRQDPRFQRILSGPEPATSY